VEMIYWSEMLEAIQLSRTWIYLESTKSIALFQRRVKAAM